MTVYQSLEVELDTLRESLIETIESSDETQGSSSTWRQGHDAVALFSLSHAFMEEELQVLIRRGIFNEEHRETEAIINLVNNRGFYNNMTLAHDTGLIGPGLKGKINDVRKTRNSLLHETDERLNIDHWKGQIDKINKAADTPYELLDVVNGQSSQD